MCPELQPIQTHERVWNPRMKNSTIVDENDHTNQAKEPGESPLVLQLQSHVPHTMQSSVTSCLACSCIGKDDYILMIHEQWLELILKGEKTLEVRSQSCSTKIGQTIWLCPCGRSKNGESEAVGKALVKSSHGPLSPEQWVKLRPAHLVEGPRPYKSCYAWEFAEVERLQQPVRFKRQHGAQIWQKGCANSNKKPR